MRVCGERLIRPGKAGCVGHMIGIKADVRVFARNRLPRQPAPDHGQLGLSVTIFPRDPGADAAFHRRRLRCHRIGAQQTGQLRHIKVIGCAGDDDPVSIGPIGVDPVERGTKDIC